MPCTGNTSKAEPRWGDVRSVLKDFCLEMVEMDLWSLEIWKFVEFCHTFVLFFFFNKERPWICPCKTLRIWCKRVWPASLEPWTGKRWRWRDVHTLGHSVVEPFVLLENSLLLQFTNKMLFLNAMIWQTEIKWKWYCVLIHSRFSYTLTHTLYDFMIFLWFSVSILPAVLQGCVENQMAAELQDDWLNLTQKERDPWIHLDALWWVGWRWKPKQNENRAVYFWWQFSTLNTLNTGSLCSFFQEVLHDIFLLDGHEQKTFVFLYLPLFLTNAKVNHDVDLLGALKFLVEIYDRLLQHRCLMLTGLGPRSMSSKKTSEFPMDFRISNPKPCEVHRSGWICHHWLWWWKTSKIFPHYEPRF